MSIRCGTCKCCNAILAHDKMRRLARVDAGVCRDCGVNKTNNGSTRCDRCKKAEKTRGKNRYHKRKMYGTCVSCNREFDTLGIRCEPCVKKLQPLNARQLRKRYYSSKERGICVRCHINPATRTVVCEGCLEKAAASKMLRERKALALAAGKCVRRIERRVQKTETSLIAPVGGALSGGTMNTTASVAASTMTLP